MSYCAQPVVGKHAKCWGPDMQFHSKLTLAIPGWNCTCKEAISSWYVTISSPTHYNNNFNQVAIGTDMLRLLIAVFNSSYARAALSGFCQCNLLSSLPFQCTCAAIWLYGATFRITRTLIRIGTLRIPRNPFPTGMQPLTPVLVARDSWLVLWGHLGTIYQ